MVERTPARVLFDKLTIWGKPKQNIEDIKALDRLAQRRCFIRFPIVGIWEPMSLAIFDYNTLLRQAKYLVKRRLFSCISYYKLMADNAVLWIPGARMA